MQNELEIISCDIYDRESDSELDEMLDSEYYPSSDEENNKFVCFCCSKTLLKTSKSNHLKSQKHLTNLQAAENKKELLLKLSKPF
jgi:hypothetical protein